MFRTLCRRLQRELAVEMIFFFSWKHNLRKIFYLKCFRKSLRKSVIKLASSVCAVRKMSQYKALHCCGHERERERERVSVVIDPGVSVSLQSCLAGPSAAFCIHMTLVKTCRGGCGGCLLPGCRTPAAAGPPDPF